MIFTSSAVFPSEALNAAVSLSSFPVEAAVISTAAAELASSPKIVFMYSACWAVPSRFFSKLACISFRMVNTGRVFPLLSEVFTPSSFSASHAFPVGACRRLNTARLPVPAIEPVIFASCSAPTIAAVSSMLTPAFFATGAA